MKRLGAILATLIFVVGLLAGCGGKATTSPAAAEPAQAEAKPTGTNGKWDSGL